MSERKIVDYIIARNTDPDELKKYIIVMSKDGYELYGNLFSHMTNNNYAKYCQAMVKYDSN